MLLDLPEVIANYFMAQNAPDAEAIAGCFAADARVHDEGKDYQGAAEIRGWIEATTAQYRPQVEPLESRHAPDHVTVVSRVSGTFPGSPVVLNYRFEFDPEGLIASLQVQ